MHVINTSTLLHIFTPRTCVLEATEHVSIELTRRFRFCKNIIYNTFQAARQYSLGLNSVTLIVTLQTRAQLTNK
jgi:hypothetical protein